MFINSAQYIVHSAQLLQITFIAILGLIVGSFLTAFSYRFENNMSIAKGRSICPNCKKQIEWYDNIPVISYLLLDGKCRKCSKKISIRYPLIELMTAVVFLAVSLVYFNCLANSNILCKTTEYLGFITLPYFLLIAALLLLIFVIDMEHQIIPDLFTFTLLILVMLPITLIPFDDIYARLFAGFVPSVILLILALITKGKGMGLGDVKFAIPAGMLAGWPGTLYWLYLSFLTGAVVGIILLLVGKASMKSKIAFGPFLVFSLIVTILFGDFLAGILIL